MLDRTRVWVTDLLANVVASWKFIFFYTGAMFAWLLLHDYGIIQIDSPDFTFWNLFLAWFAGIQASIVLMSDNRQSDKDRRMLKRSVELDEEQVRIRHFASKAMTTKLNKIINKIDKLEEIIGLMEDEEENK